MICRNLEENRLSLAKDVCMTKLLENKANFVSLFGTQKKTNKPDRVTMRPDRVTALVNFALCVIHGGRMDEQTQTDRLLEISDLITKGASKNIYHLFCC